MADGLTSTSVHGKQETQTILDINTLLFRSIQVLHGFQDFVCREVIFLHMRISTCKMLVMNGNEIPARGICTQQRSSRTGHNLQPQNLLMVKTWSKFCTLKKECSSTRGRKKGTNLVHLQWTSSQIHFHSPEIIWDLGFQFTIKLQSLLCLEFNFLPKPTRILMATKTLNISPLWQNVRGVRIYLLNKKF